MDPSPIALFVYNRHWHLKQTIEALKKNDLAKESDLFIFSDYQKSESDKENVFLVREYIKTIAGFKKVNIIKRCTHLGLAQSIINGITEIVNNNGQIIVLEDDLVTSPYFLRFINDALDFYKHEEQVISIHGYIYPLKSELPETFFLRGADCWGWATWKRGWDIFESNGEKLLNDIKKLNLQEDFDFNGTYPYLKMLIDQIRKRNDSWAIRWYASAFLANKLTLYPGRSLVKHIGYGGTNFGSSDIFDAILTDNPIIVKNITIEENIDARKHIEEFFKKNKRSLFSYLKDKIKYALTHKSCA